MSLTWTERLHGWLGARTGLGSLSIAARVAGAVAPSHERFGLRRVRGVPYLGTGLEAHRLDVWIPADVRGPRPIVMYIHGGAFQGLSKDTHWPMAQQFARNGYVVFAINYRLAPVHRFPAALEDCCAAFLWIVDHAITYGGDPNRIAVAGESAGGNLTASLAICSAYPREEPWASAVFASSLAPRVVAPACGIFQVTDAQRLSRDLGFSKSRIALSAYAAESYLPRSKSLSDLRELVSCESHDLGSLDLADPVSILEGPGAPRRPLPAHFLCVGTRDALLNDTQRMESALARHGVPHQARYYDGEAHVFHALLWRKAARRCWSDMLSFVDRHVGATDSA